MAGIQEISAILGVLDIGFRSISALYNFVRDLNDTSKEIQRVWKEIEALQRCLQELCELRIPRDDARAAIARIGLQQSVHDCGEVCAKLHGDLLKWTANSSHTVRVKVRIRWHKKDIEKAIDDIALTKQTAILSILVAQLSIQLGCSATAGTRTELVGEARSGIETVAREMENRNIPSADLVKRGQMAVTQVESTSQKVDISAETHRGTNPGVAGGGGLGRAPEPGQSTAAPGSEGGAEQEWHGNTFTQISSATGIQDLPPSTSSVRQLWKDNKFEGSKNAKIIGISYRK